MTAEIISVGTELLLGNILNTNAQYLSRELAALGITVQRESTIGDNHGRLADFVNEAKQRCDLLVFTGGLGPTADDLTKETIAGCYGDTLAFDPEEWQKIVDFFTRTGRKTTPNNRKQAMVPVNGHKIINNHGTAPGAWFEQDGHCAVLMPGVPHEMKAMWEESVRPLLLARQNCTLHSITLRVLGGESDIEYRVRHLLENANPTAAIYCKTGECEIRITARAETDSSAEKMCRAYATKFYDLLGDAVYDEDVTGLEETLVHTLKEKGLTIATAESCTGGTGTGAASGSGQSSCRYTGTGKKCPARCCGSDGTGQHLPQGLIRAAPGRGGEAVDTRRKNADHLCAAVVWRTAVGSTTGSAADRTCCPVPQPRCRNTGCAAGRNAHGIEQGAESAGRPLCGRAVRRRGDDPCSCSGAGAGNAPQAAGML